PRSATRARGPRHSAPPWSWHAKVWRRGRAASTGVREATGEEIDAWRLLLVGAEAGRPDPLRTACEGVRRCVWSADRRARPKQRQGRRWIAGPARAVWFRDA